MNTEPMALRCSKELKKCIQDVSSKEHRTTSNMIRVLVLEALEARKIIPEKAA